MRCGFNRQVLLPLVTGAALLWSALAAGQTPGVTATSVVVGESAAFTGPAAQLGIQMRAGMKLYFDHINAQGGVPIKVDGQMIGAVSVSGAPGGEKDAACANAALELSLIHI